MERFAINQFDSNTFVVVDQNQQKEICVCGNYDDEEDAEERARKIAFLLNEFELPHNKLTGF
jgi:hypothetical protein